MTDQYQTLRYVHRSSDEFKVFLKKLEDNYESSNKQSVCLLCWGFLTSYQKKKHMAHQVYIINPSFCKNEEMFLKHATNQKKLRDNNQLIALLNDQCAQLLENHYLTPQSMQNHRAMMPNQAALQQSSRMGLAPNTKNICDLKDLSQKQFDQELRLKRFLHMHQELRDQYDAQQNQLKLIIDQLESIQSKCNCYFQRSGQSSQNLSLDVPSQLTPHLTSVLTQEPLLKVLSQNNSKNLHYDRDPGLLTTQSDSNNENSQSSPLGGHSQSQNHSDSSNSYKSTNSLMIPGPKVEILDRDNMLISMAVATNNSQGNDTAILKEIVVDTQAINNMDSYGIKPQQYLEEEFRLSDTGFTNVKNKKKQSVVQIDSIPIPSLFSVTNNELMTQNTNETSHTYKMSQVTNQQLKMRTAKTIKYQLRKILVENKGKAALG
eukprot:403341271